MKQVYEKNLWGSNDQQFYSGIGSHDGLIVSPYIEAVSKFLQSFDEAPSICDLGCGDFNVGNQLLDLTSGYIAIDIVPELIAYNQNRFRNEKLDFLCLDIAKDDLPLTDCVILRQVLQHLSNAEILQILPKLKFYKYLILTEHVPQGDFTPNIDIISGQGIRLKKNSGVVLEEAPFNFKSVSKKELLRVNLENDKGCIITWIYCIF
ncbi:MAG: class I SAM-dependent methyltransferase [Nonlabens sp.]